MTAVMTAARRGIWLLSFVAPRAASRVAFELFCHPLRRVAVRPHEVAAHGAATVEKVDVDGKEIVLYSWGDGVRPVLFLHGWESRGSRVAPLVQPLLDAGFSPVSFDAPGHGAAASRGNSLPFYRLIALFVQERWGAPAAIVGHSFGVPAAFYALKTGVSAGCLVGVAGPCRFDLPPEDFSRRLGLRPSVARDLRRRVETALAPLTDVWSALSADYRPELVTVPIFLVHDDGDQTVPLAEAERTKAAFGERAELVVTTGLGHSRILADADVVQRIVAFVTVAGRSDSATRSP